MGDNSVSEESNYLLFPFFVIAIEVVSKVTCAQHLITDLNQLRFMLQNL